ncbi:hypothetical protein KCMC57_64430 (plasmid) [Kitasatospora sp. CMC57]|uniref:Uncharacterized protein n=1 Tax=Kitasatospora sp. CMC57 TaxID=3231513 RepID=A0AB33K7A5_9ACTN
MSPSPTGRGVPAATAAPGAAQRRGRGQPARLDPATPGGAARRQTLLDALRTGASLAEAATAAGVSRSTIHNTRDRDPDFASALLDAQHAHRRAGQPLCPACAEAALVLTVDGVACRACTAQYRLTPVLATPVAEPDTGGDVVTFPTGTVLAQAG